MPQQNYLITTAIPYANGAPHIGHAYERIATDVMARFARLDGADVLFVTGMARPEWPISECLISIAR